MCIIRHSFLFVVDLWYIAGEWYLHNLFVSRHTKEDFAMGRTYAKMRSTEGPGFIPAFSVDPVSHSRHDRAPLSGVARCHYEFLLSNGLPSRFRELYSGVARHLGDGISLLDFKTPHDFDVFSQTPEKYVQERGGVTLFEDVYSFLRWDGSFVSASEDGFGRHRYLVLQKVLSCSVPVAEHEGDFAVVSKGETVKRAFDAIIYSRGWYISGILFEQKSGGRLSCAILYLPGGIRRMISPYE